MAVVTQLPSLIAPTVAPVLDSTRFVPWRYPHLTLVTAPGDVPAATPRERTVTMPKAEP